MTIRIARFSRVSSAQQATSDREGLPFQHDLQDEAIRRLDAEDTGIAWSVAKSGGTVHQTPQFADMLAQAGKTFDGLAVAYQSRLGRETEEVLRAIRLINAAGAFVYFAEEERDTRNPTDMEAIRMQAAEDENYRTRLSRTMKRTTESKARRRGLPNGPTPFGFEANWSHNTEEAATVRSIFEAYAAGGISLRQLADRHGLKLEHVKVMIRNPAYVGLAQHNGTLYPGSMPPIVSPATWDAVVAIRSAGQFAKGSKPAKPSILSKRLHCACGARIRLDGSGKTGARVWHPDPLCATWGPHHRKMAHHFTEPIRAALRALRPTNALLHDMEARLSDTMPTPPPDTRLARELAGRRLGRKDITPEAFITELARLDALEQQERPAAPRITVEDLRAFYGQFRNLDGATESAWALFAGQVFSRYEYHGPERLRLNLTDAGRRCFVPMVLPKVVKVGGEGSSPANPTPIRNVALEIVAIEIVALQSQSQPHTRHDALWQP